MLLRILLFLAFLLGGGTAFASTAQQVTPGTETTTGCPSSALTPCFLPYSPSNPMPVGGGATGAGTVASTTQVSVSSGSASTVYTGGTAANGFVRIKVQEGSASSVDCNWAGTTATTSNSETMAPGESIVFGPLSNSISCIGVTGSATVVVSQ